MSYLSKLLVALLCTVIISACAGSAGRGTYVIRAAPNGHVFLVPKLNGGSAGWCMATGWKNTMEGSSGCAAPRVFAGPIIAQTCERDESRIEVYALTAGNVSAVSVAGAKSSIVTTSNPTLPRGIRDAAIELIPQGGHSNVCPKVTAIDRRGKQIRQVERRSAPLAFVLPARRHWIRSGTMPRGLCELTTTDLPNGVVADSGVVATRIVSYRGLIGRALLSCVNTLFIYGGEHHLTSAVLLDAAHPGATPSGLPGMRPIAGQSGIFESPGVGGERVARRIAGAWIIVEEEDGIGLSVPLDILKHIRASVHIARNSHSEA